MKTLFLVLCFLASPCMAQQLFSNPTFTSWPHGPVVAGSYGPGTETAQGWISKWNKSPVSSAVVSRLNPTGGLHYALYPAPGVMETFYLRQTYHDLAGSLGKRFKAVVAARALSPHVRGGFYINARWNNDQRLPIINTDQQLKLWKGQLLTWTAIFRMPTDAGINWPVTDSSGVEFAFLVDTARVAQVNVRSITLVPWQEGSKRFSKRAH